MGGYYEIFSRDSLTKVMGENKKALDLKTKRKLENISGQKSESKFKQKIPSCSTNIDYGPNAEQPCLTEEEFESEKTRFLNSLKVTSKKLKDIQKQSIGQWGNPVYEAERQNRLTASVFGSVFRRRPNTNCKSLVGQILSPLYFSTDGIRYGKDMEGVARQKFAGSRLSVKVSECGLFIDKQYPHLAATPDGLVGENGILEIKCLHKIHKSGKTLVEAIITDKTLCVEIIDHQISLKRNHNYYYQVK